MSTSFADLMPSRFYKSEDVKDEPIVRTIASIKKEDVWFKDKPVEKVTIIRFQESEREMIAKNDVLGFLKDAFGTPDACTGKAVELYFEPSVTYGGKKVGGLRLRAPSGDTGPAF